MITIGNKRAVVSLSIALVLMAGLAIWSFVHGLKNDLLATLTDNWAMVLDEMREYGLERTNVTEVASTLRDIGRWYHPPQPPAPGTERHLYNLMERVKAGTERDIIRHLRVLTDEDLGDNPKPWIEKYAKPEK